MGACLSCLGLGGRESHDSESSRLLDDDLYPGGYGYGSLNHGQQSQGDPEYSRREREALEAICQRASDSVIDIWALQPQPHLQPAATLRSNGSASASVSVSASSSRVPSNEIPAVPAAATTDHHRPDSSSGVIQHEPKRPPSATTMTVSPSQKKLAAAPKHWGEVVITNKKGKKTSRVSGQDDNGNDLFGVLRVP